MSFLSVSDRLFRMKNSKETRALELRQLGNTNQLLWINRAGTKNSPDGFQRCRDLLRNPRQVAEPETA